MRSTASGRILGLLWTSARPPLDTYWPSATSTRLLLDLALDLSWASDLTSSGPLLGLRWTSTGRLLCLPWISIRPLRGPYCTSAGLPQDLSWNSTGHCLGLLVHIHWTVTKPALDLYWSSSRPPPLLDLYWTSYWTSRGPLLGPCAHFLDLPLDLDWTPTALLLDNHLRATATLLGSRGAHVVK